MSTHQKIESEHGASTMDVAAVVTALEQVLAALALTTQPVTVKQRKAATRSRKGMEKVIPALSILSIEHGVNVPKQPTSAMTASLERVNLLEPIRQKLVSLVTLVTDAIDAERSESWNTATTLYGMLQKAAHRDPQLRSQLAPIEEFFRYRHPSVKKNQREKKAALKAEKQAAAQATAESSAVGTPAIPSTASATASTNVNAAPAVGAGVAPSNVVASHVA